MSKSKKGLLNKFEKIGKTIVMPITILPIAALLLTVGQPDLWQYFGALPNGIPWMIAVGTAVFNNLPLIFAISIAVGLADKNNGMAAIAAVVGYFILISVAKTINKNINIGILVGVIVGVLSSQLYNKYKEVKTFEYLGFFGGKKFVLIITSMYSLLIGIITGYLWPIIQKGINIAVNNNNIFDTGTKGVFLLGFFNRLLMPFGLNTVEYTSSNYMAGLFPIMMFALPASCLAMIKMAKKENKKNITVMFLYIAFISLITGIAEPIEFIFMFLSPLLYVVHAFLAGLSFALASYIGIKNGFEFSPGLIDYLLNLNSRSNPLAIIGLGVVFGVIYYFIFILFIKKFDIQTPGRYYEEELVTLSNLKNDELDAKAEEIIEAIGGKENIISIKACITRIRLKVVEETKVDEDNLKEIGVTGVIKLDKVNYVIVVGNTSEILVKKIKKYLT
ncbi:N-acetylglucosamine-specific PTS transporter subunit IIBC [Clostridium sediminicola]|uniref:PTS transporter subunit EIIC n=1 Tax=Clostridium sediminicola TaxID=3114879 RepID=UPI0031F257BA